MAKKVHEGWMYKEGGGTHMMSNKNFKKRWFVLLDNHMLQYFKAASDSTPIKSVDMSNSKVAELQVEDHQLIKLTILDERGVEERTHHFKTESDDDFDTWFAAIRGQTPEGLEEAADLAAERAELDAERSKQQEEYEAQMAEYNRARLNTESAEVAKTLEKENPALAKLAAEDREPKSKKWQPKARDNSSDKEMRAKLEPSNKADLKAKLDKIPKKGEEVEGKPGCGACCSVM